MAKNSVRIIFFICISLTSYAQNEIERFKEGQKLFVNNCLPCHSVHHELLGPQLASITKKRPAAWLIKFIRNSKKVILSGDEYATYLFKQYNNVNMPPFEHLSVKQISDILYYINRESENKRYKDAFPTKYELDKVLTSVDGQYPFYKYCSRCHAVENEILGPALGSVTKRRPVKWLYNFIRNPDSMATVNDYAKFLDESYPDHNMPPFGYLSDKEIDEILYYIERKSSAPTYIAGVNGKTPAVADYIPAYQDINIKSKEKKVKTSLVSNIAIVLVTILSAIAHIWLIYKLFIYISQKKYL